MTIAAKQPDEITGQDITDLIGADPERQRIAVLGEWSRGNAAIAAASLANTDGGVLIVGALADESGRVTAIPGSPVTEADLLSAVQDLGPTGPYLAKARVIAAGGKRVGILAVAQSAAPPVLVETTGELYRRTSSGLARVRTREDLDDLLGKDRLSRQRAETNIEGMIGRVAFGHFNYMTVAVVSAPRIATGDPYRWAVANKTSLVDHSLGLAQRWGFSESHIRVRPGEVEISLPDEVTGFLRISGNGTVAAGERQHRPPQDRYLSPLELGGRLAELAEAVSLPFRSTEPGVVLGCLYLEGVRDLRLPLESGATAPVAKDLVRQFLPERFLEAEPEREAFARDVREVTGRVFSADLLEGLGKPFAGPEKAKAPEPKTWHGITKRTERRLAGLRGHGSAR